MISFSIIIPVYNASKYIGRCIDSCLNQTHASFEVICVDDCSEDDSVSVIDTFTKRDPRVSLIRHERNMSQYMARQTGVKRARHEYVLFLDSDDYLELNACSLLNREIERQPVDVLQFGYRERPGDKKVFSEKILSRDARIKALLRASDRYPPELWTKAYKKSVLLHAFAKINPFYATLAEDVFLSVVIAHNAEEFGYLRKCLVNYSIGSGSTTDKNPTDKSLLGNLESYKTVIENIRGYVITYCPEYEPHLDSMRQYFLEDFIRNRLCDTLYDDRYDDLLASLPEYFGRKTVIDFLKLQNCKSSRYDYWFSGTSGFHDALIKIAKYGIKTLKGNNAYQENK